MQNDAIAAVQAATDTVTEMAINGTGVNEAIAVVLKAAKAVAGKVNNTFLFVTFNNRLHWFLLSNSYK